MDLNLLFDFFIGFQDSLNLKRRREKTGLRFTFLAG